MPPDEPTKLLVLWTSGDREVALHMVLMYTGNAARWESRGRYDSGAETVALDAPAFAVHLRLRFG